VNVCVVPPVGVNIIGFGLKVKPAQLGVRVTWYGTATCKVTCIGLEVVPL